MASFDRMGNAVWRPVKPFISKAKVVNEFNSLYWFRMLSVHSVHCFLGCNIFESVKLRKARKQKRNESKSIARSHTHTQHTNHVPALNRMNSKGFNQLIKSCIKRYFICILSDDRTEIRPNKINIKKKNNIHLLLFISQNEFVAD